MAITHTDPTAIYLDAVGSGRPDAVLDLFAGPPIIEDPRGGRIVGAAAARDFIETQSAWMREHAFEAVPLRSTIGSGRSLAEFVATLDVGGTRTELPVAVVGDRVGARLAAIRVYHSTWPLEGSHRLRPPIVPEDRRLALPDVVGRYMEALDAADLAGSMSVFEPDGYFREPSGGPHVYRGLDGIREAYGAFYAVGPIHLLHCTVIDDGVACGVEFIARGWGPRRFPLQAGIGVYERGASGLLHAARVYDDVDVDLGLQP